MRLPDALAELPVLVRYAVLGAFCAGAAGAAVGLVLGLRAYPPTAWVATFEVGIPAVLLGGFAGFVVGAVSLLAGRVRTHFRS